MFDGAWEQLRTYLTQARGWESLIEQQRYQLDSFSDMAIDYTRLSTGERDSITKQQPRLASRLRGYQSLALRIIRTCH